MRDTLGLIDLPKDTNYIAAFLTFACQLRCNYCINHHGGDLVKKRRMTGQEWIAALDRLPARPDLPITLQGGEPTVHSDFYEIVSHKPLWGKLDLLTNFVLDEQEFCRKVPVEVFKRDAPYASIRVSWHTGQNDSLDLLTKVAYLTRLGYSIGIWAVDHPDHKRSIRGAQIRAEEMGIDFRLKEFLGPHGGIEHGTIRYNDSVNSNQLRFCECRTSELLISPDGNIFRCHSDLYANRLPVAHVLNQSTPLLGKFIPCAVYGRCNSCDVKIKNNRHQIHGHSSVAIKNISQPYGINKERVTEVINTYGKADNIKIDL